MSSADTTRADDLFTKLWKHETVRICEYVTSRLDGDRVNPNLITVRNIFFESAKQFNESYLKNIQFIPFEWCKKKDDVVISKEGWSNTPIEGEHILDAQYWVFGFRVGPKVHSKKVSIICHLDTVPADPDSTEWNPFHPTVENLDYEHGTVPAQDFLIGRGCIDDKGPAISAFLVARALALEHDSSTAMNDTLIEILFDSSEETNMSTPHFLEDPSIEKPTFGVVYDAMWCVRAEKGGERPIFTVSDSSIPSSGIFISSLVTNPSSSTNTIPDWAEAEIRGDPTELAKFARDVSTLYKEFEFDDPAYISAPLDPPKVNQGEDGIESVTLRTLVVGAQHGSAPEENRKNGANPLVSLANFLAGQISSGTLRVNALGSIVEFIRWTWGTYVFGEKHREALYEFDEVFVEGNGTTYAVTKMNTAANGDATLEIDIRYAIPHNKGGWDGETEGLLPIPESRFKGIFVELIEDFNTSHDQYPDVNLKETETIFQPDIRLPESNPDFQMVMQAYKEVRGVDSPLFAIGGGTDAKGYTFLLGVGPLFAKEMGPPINYHGIMEGAPMVDFKTSTAVLYRVMSLAIENRSVRPAHETENLVQKSIAHMRELRKNGYVSRCSC